MTGKVIKTQAAKNNPMRYELRVAAAGSFPENPNALAGFLSLPCFTRESEPIPDDGMRLLSATFFPAANLVFTRGTGFQLFQPVSDTARPPTLSRPCRMSRVGTTPASASSFASKSRLGKGRARRDFPLQQRIETEPITTRCFSEAPLR